MQKNIISYTMYSYANVVYGYDKEYITQQQTYILRKNTWPPRSQRVAWIIWFSLTWRDLQGKTIIKSWPIILLHIIDKAFLCLRVYVAISKFSMGILLQINGHHLYALLSNKCWVSNALFIHLYEYWNYILSKTLLKF